MRCFHFSARVALAGLVAFSASDATAQITEFDLEVVASPALDGREFGGIGAYERLRGIVRGAVDPEDRRNRDIVNIDRASRNADGLVEYRATVEIYRPVNMSKWNGAIFHTVSNRGGAGAAEPALLARGFAFVRIGWQGDLEPTESNIVAYLPIATNGEHGSGAGGVHLQRRRIYVTWPAHLPGRHARAFRRDALGPGAPDRPPLRALGP